MCSELWRFFFKEKTPEQYLAADPGEVPGQFFQTGSFGHIFVGSGTSFRVTEQTNAHQPDEDVVLELDFCINSPMIYEVVKRRYILKKSSSEQYHLTLFMSGYYNPDNDSQEPSQKRWDWVRAWMTECTSKDYHQLCSRALEAIELSPYLPTRVIEVTPFSDIEGRKRYRLIETASSVLKDQRYATLSHVWGANQQPLYRTLRNNYHERLCNGVLRNDLPACFQDAIDVAETLAIPYIWIDSLCIIQDDEIDCPVEAGSMDQVYSNSFLNLSATASSSSKDRLPSVAKNDHLQEPRFVSTEWKGRYKGLYQIFDPQLWSDRVESTRLASRGWVFQERALAPRVLHFGFDQVLWECAESERAEELPHGIPLRSTATGREGFKWHLNMDPWQNVAARYGTATVLPQKTPMQHADLHKKWSTVLSQYTRCELTRASDKLVAISGIAKVLADRFNDTYMAGLWQSNLIGGLCWRLPQMRRTTQDLIPSYIYARRWEISRRLEGNGAPSWSWASVDGVVEAGPFQSDERVHGLFTEPQTGAVGYKTCSSALLSAPKADVIPKTDKNPYGEVDTERTRLQLHGTTYPLELCPLELHPLGSQGELSFRHFGTQDPLTVYLDQPEESDAVKDAIFLPLIHIKHFVVKEGGAEEPNSAVHRYDLDRLTGIVLAPIEGTEMYRRIGLNDCQAQRLDHLRGYEGIVCLQ
jgi:hypothetical protein